MIYLDYAATTPVDPRVLEAMIPYFCEIFSNPSSKHSCGRKAAKAVLDARKVLADLIGARTSQEVIFTAGASEANNLAIKGVAECYEEPKHFITSTFEHKATLNAMKCVEEWGHSVSYIKPGPGGIIDPRDVKDAIRSETVLCSIMLVNNEIGTIQPIDDIADICSAQGVMFHTDATQGFGKLPIRVGSNIDMMSLSAHKFYGPKGIGILYASSELPLKCQISGGSQENGLRAGTLNVPGIVGMAKAAQLACAEMQSHYDKLKGFEQDFLWMIRNKIPMSYLQGDPDAKVPWINNICFYGADAGRIRDELGKREICVSRSSACSKSSSASHVLEAIGTDETLLSGAVRFSFGSRTTKERIRTAADATAEIVRKLRGR